MKIKLMYMFFRGVFTNDNTPLSIYNRNNFFEVSIPFSCLLGSNPQEENYLSYLPTKIQKNDRIKIKEYMSNHLIYDKNMEYRISFYLDPQGVHLKNISIKHLKKEEEPMVKKDNRTYDTKIKRWEINEKDILTVTNYKKGCLISENLPIYLVNQIDRTIDCIHDHQQQQKNFLKNPKYILILEKNASMLQIIGIQIIDGEYEEIFFVLNTPKGGAQLIKNQQNEVLGKKVTGIFAGAPTCGALQKLGSPFGIRKDPKNPKVFKHHGGQDIRVPTGTPILSVADGVVVDCGYNKGYGNFIVVHHGRSTKDGYSSLYAHLSKINITLRDPVKKGQIIGISGSTGRSTGPHLHFEWITNIDGKRVNPIHVYYKKKHIAHVFQPLMSSIVTKVKQIFRQYKEEEKLPF